MPDTSLLTAIGLTADEFADLPIETQAIYAGNRAGNIASATKYYRTLPADSVLEGANNTFNAINEIEYPENILVEVSQAEYAAAEIALLNQGTATNGLSDSESHSGTWYQITAKLIEVEDGFGVTIGQYGQYVFTMTATVIGDKLDPTGFHDDHVGYIGGSMNQHCSPIKNSEFCITKLYPNWSATPQTNTETLAPYKGFGCGFNYSIGYMASKAEITMTYSLAPRQAISLVDAYTHLGYWDDNTSIAQIAVSFGPLSATITPTKNLVRAPDLHLQLRV